MNTKTITDTAERKKVKRAARKKAAAKRYHVTGTGKIRYKKQGLRHILTKKTTKRKRALRRSTLVDSANLKEIKRLIPYL